MKTLVIHPYDPTTIFLSEIYAGRGWDVINMNISKSALAKAIKKHDHIIMMGHGTPYGLLGFGRFVIDSNFVHLLREKQCTMIWCNADEFVQKYKLKGLHSGMIISELGEAYDFCVPATADEVDESNTMFAEAIRETLDADDPLTMFNSLYEGESDLIMFNRKRMYIL